MKKRRKTEDRRRKIDEQSEEIPRSGTEEVVQWYNGATVQRYDGTTVWRYEEGRGEGGSG